MERNRIFFIWFLILLTLQNLAMLLRLSSLHTIQNFKETYEKSFFDNSFHAIG